MKKLGLALTRFAVDRPKTIVGLIVLPTLVLMLLAGLPSLWPTTFAPLHSVKVDTDPENMLAHDEPVRVFHDRMKKQFSLNDMVVVGVVNEHHAEGVFNPATLQRVYELTEFAKTLTWPDPDDPEKTVGVVEVDVIAPSTVDNVESGGLGVVNFEWLMPRPPETPEDALAVRRKAQDIPFLNDTLVSRDGQAIGLYFPLTSKDLSYRVYSALRAKIAEFDGKDRFLITGLPVAEDVFGVQMFKQMAMSAPLAMLVIFLLMLYFFRKLSLIISPLIIAMISVIVTMSLLIITGQTIHIMSSMIPIFIMPIAVLDAVHILSMFFDRYQDTRDIRRTILVTMDSLFMPMFYTSLTSAAGFASLALTPIPPVQTFGLFCAFGILTAWLLTITFIPAFVTFIPESRLQNFGHVTQEGASGGRLSVLLRGMGGFTYKAAIPILVATAVVVVVALYGIRQIRVNDNPIKWFESEHPIRVADRILNDHFGGTYMAYLALLAEEESESLEKLAAGFKQRLDRQAEALKDEVPEVSETFPQVKKKLNELLPRAESYPDLLEQLAKTVDEWSAEADDAMFAAWDEASLSVEREQQRRHVFKDPEVLRYITKIEEGLKSVKLENGKSIVGKSNSVTDIVKTVHRELYQGKEEQEIVPDSPEAVAQCLLTFQSGHRPQDLWHFVTPDYRNGCVWLQLRSGDNIEMARVLQAFKTFMKENPPPRPMQAKWFGLTYINVVWQEKMVYGMLYAFLGSFLVVFLMMTLLFRSALWGFLCMIPLTVTIALIYGAIGLVGKDYDMPVAVLSAMALGLAVDFAIHFLEHSRVHRVQEGDWKTAAPHVFGDPARAIARNIVVIAVGFLPLLAAPLVPYKTVGVLLASILAVSGVATLLILPALVRLLEGNLFPETRRCCFTCNCITCIASSVGIVALIAINMKQILEVGWTSMTWISLVAIPILALGCHFMSKREKCQLDEQAEAAKQKTANTEGDES